MPHCAICEVERMDLSQHIRRVHGMTVSDYRKRYGFSVVDPSIEEKRKRTCLERHGNCNYRNAEARKLSNEVYSGGHSFRDPVVRAKALRTKEELYGDPNYTNREKAKQTCLEKYGVNNPNKVRSIIEKRLKTCFERYGRVFNHTRAPVFSKEGLIDLHAVQKLSLVEIGKRYGMSAARVGYWMKKHDVPVTKKIVLPWMKSSHE